MEPQYSIDKISIDKYSIDNIMHGATNVDSVPEASPIVELILNDKTFYNVYQSQVDHWQELYPAVDIKQELLKMQGWLESNPKRRKTKRGIKSFITNWLSKAQDKNSNVKNEPQTQRSGEEAARKYQSSW